MKYISYLAPLLAAAQIGNVCAAPARFNSNNSPNQPQMLTAIIVTAQKVAQPAVKVPMTVVALNGRSLSANGMNSFADYAAQVPGMSVTALTPGYSSVVLRGMSTGISQATPSTGFYIDDAPVGSVTAYATGGILTPDLPPSEVKQIEVLEGPQGTLYGAGTIGGLVRFVTVQPDPKAFGGSVGVGGDAIDGGGAGWSARMALNAPINSDNAVRASVYRRNDPGFISDPITGQHDVNSSNLTVARLAWKWRIDNDWSAYVWGLTQRFSANGINAQEVTAPSLTPVTGDLTRGTYIPETQRVAFDVYNATIKGSVGGWALLSSTTYQTISAHTNVDQTATFGPLFSLLLGIPNLGVRTLQIVDTKRWSEELRANAAALHDTLHYMLGMYYTHEASGNRLPPLDPFTTPNLQPFLLLGPVANAAIVTTYDEYSPFANASYDITSKLQIQFGLRYTHYTENYAQNYQTSLLSPVPVILNQQVAQNKLTYMASLRYMPSKHTEVYGRVATGFQPGGPSALPPGVVAGGKQSFNPSSVTSYELGLKSNFAHGLGSVEAALFDTNWNDVQIQTSTTTAAGSYQYFVNGGTARSDGADATVLIEPLRGLSVRATGAYTNSRLTSAAPAAGGLNGDRMPFSPKWTGSLVADYRFVVSGGLRPFMGVSWNYIGERVSNFTEHQPPNPADLPSNKVSVPSYTTVNIHVGVDVHRLRLMLYVKNVGNSRGINFINNVGLALPVLNPLGNPFVEGIIPPRTIGGEASYRF